MLLSQPSGMHTGTSSMGLARKVTRGDAWFPLHVGRTYYNSLNQYCIEVTRKGDEDIDQNFEYGKPVVCSSKTF